MIEAIIFIVVFIFAIILIIAFEAVKKESTRPAPPKQTKPPLPTVGWFVVPKTTEAVFPPTYMRKLVTFHREGTGTYIVFNEGSHIGYSENDYLMIPAESGLDLPSSLRNPLVDESIDILKRRYAVDPDTTPDVQNQSEEVNTFWEKNPASDRH